MTGNSFNKQSGQVLLIVVMLVAVVITIILTVTFTSQTETKITKLEEENQKALAAAEAGIEAKLQQGGTSNLDLLTVGNGNLTSTIKSGSVTSSPTGGSTYAASNVQKDDAYTFYLKNYPGFGTPAPSNNTQAITLCFGTGSAQPALDVALIKTPNVIRYAVNGGTSVITGAASATSGCTISGTNYPQYSYSYIIPAADVSTDSQLLVVRPLGANTDIMISQTNLPSQGNTLTSEAISKTGVKKRIQLTQSNPQIPSDFFTTSF